MFMLTVLFEQAEMIYDEGRWHGCDDMPMPGNEDFTWMENFFGNYPDSFYNVNGYVFS